MKRQHIVIGFLTLVLGITFFLLIFFRPSGTEENFISRAMAAKMLALSQDEVAVKDDEQWYDPYIEIAKKKCGMSDISTDSFKPMDLLTYGQAEEIAGHFSLDVSALSFSFSGSQSAQAIASEHWYEIYEQIIAQGDRVKKMSLDILGTPSSMDSLEPWQCMTGDGVFDAVGLAMDQWEGQRIDAYVRGQEIVAVVGVAKTPAAAKEETLQSEVVKDEPISDDSTAQMIRVVLSTDAFAGYEHSSVQITSTDPFVMVHGDARTDFAADDVLTLDTSHIAAGEKATICPESETGKLTINSLNRSSGHPSYRGSLTISSDGDHLVIVNELPLEQYLYGVVPSEMPASYGDEALKTQAVCARSFAVGCLLAPRFLQYDAHVDDSTASQVYNNQGETDSANAAVDATAGEILVWQDEPVASYFYSTSSGSSASPEEVWLSGEPLAYMRGHLQTEDRKDCDYSDENAFRAFIDNYKDVDYFEKAVPWFRWQVTMSAADIREALEKSLAARAAVVPSLITMDDGSGNFVPVDVSSIGDITDITADQRGKSGVLMSVLVHGTDKTIKITGEYNIRLLLAPLNAHVICDDGTDAGTRPMLPSGFFYIDKNSDGSFYVRGGGYGHGVGMSQNGVRALAQRGLTYAEILQFYFEDTQLVTR